MKAVKEPGTAAKPDPMTGFPPILIDGEPASTDDLTYLALVNYGAYTSFRVEHGVARGVGRHLARLQASAIELFGESPGEDRLRELMRLAVEGRDACWLRVSLFSPEVWARTPSWRGMPRVMTMAAESPPPLAAALRLATRVYGRDAAHLKHTALFGLIQSRRQAQDAGFDDALFVDETGLISEGSLWNIGFVTGDRVIWPQAPMLSGVTQALIEDGLASVGLTSQTRPVRLSDLAEFDRAFICNSATPACAVTAIGDHAFNSDPTLIERLEAAWASNAPETI
jgi:branched-subunit amino acid aminotransferase/4-amino-4-deoxychorismate lyase